MRCNVQLIMQRHNGIWFNICLCMSWRTNEITKNSKNTANMSRFRYIVMSSAHIQTNIQIYFVTVYGRQISTDENCSDIVIRKIYHIFVVWYHKISSILAGTYLRCLRFIGVIFATQQLIIAFKFAKSTR